MNEKIKENTTAQNIKKEKEDECSIKSQTAF